MMNFVVPQKPVDHHISAEAAFLVYGFGGTQHPVTPWTDQTRILQRDRNSGTQAMIALIIGVPRDVWFGKLHSSGGPLRDALKAAGGLGQDVANKSIGILSSDALDPERTTLRGLAFQDHGQGCAFHPDSTVSAKDKINVRD